MKKKLLLCMAMAAMMTATAENRSLNFTQWSEATAAATEPILTLKGTVGEEVSLTFGVYETEDTYSVDFGDGNLQEKKVGINNAGPVDPETGQTTGATIFTGTVAGDGTIKVYGNNDVWYLISSGAAPTAFDQAKLMNVVQMTVSGVDVESVALPAYPKMTQFSLNNSAVKTLDVTKVPTLTGLTVTATNQSKFAPQLEAIDLSKNVELTSVSIQGYQGANGKLASLDLSNNIKLTGIYLQFNSLKQFTLPTEYTTLNNKGVPAKITLNLDNNQLTEINGLDKVPEKSLITVSNNKFTLATLPEQTANIKTYTYAPQAAYEVAESLSELDLTSQPTATPTFSFVAADGTALIEGTDYTVTEPGKFTFVKEQAQKVHGVMESSVFTAFTGAKAFVTTEFTVTASTGIQTVSAAAAGKVYNLQGVEVQKPVKGLYIQNGKKVLVK